VLPYRIPRMHQKTFIVKDNVGQHQADGSAGRFFEFPLASPEARVYSSSVTERRLGE
jgi:hypothetical protein